MVTGTFILCVKLREQLRKRVAGISNRHVKTRKEYFTVLNSLAEGVIITDVSGIIRHMNPAAEKITGWTGTESKGHNLENVLMTDDLLSGESGTNSFADIFFNCEYPNYFCSLPVLTRCEKNMIVSGSVAEIKTGGKEKSSGFVITLRDHTTDYHARINLSESEKKFRELNYTKDKLLSIIAHDLKNPFNAILGYSQLLSNHAAKHDYDAVKSYACDIQYSILQANRVLENLLNWARSQKGLLSFEPQPVNLRVTIESIFNLYASSAKTKHIRLINRVPVDMMVISDVNMLNVILRNLVSNAVKYTRFNKTVQISGEGNPEDNEFAMISVKDSGKGIPEERLRRIFNMVDIETGTDNEEGTGLGLPLCKEFVEKHGGRIWAESEPGKGTSFIFTIPVRKSTLVPDSM
jgi:K+-sensing histidine kinase KdpD